MSRCKMGFSTVGALPIGICILLLSGPCFADEDVHEWLAAVDIGHIGIVQDLIDRGADVNAREPRTGYTALHRAVIHGNEDLINLLISKGADVNAEPNGDYYIRHAPMLKPQRHGTPLRMACASGRQDLAELLITAGAELNCKDSIDGATPLHVAIRHEHAQLAKFLITNGADVNLAAQSGNKPLDYVDCAKEPELIRWLLTHGAEPTTTDKEGRTVFNVATVIHCPEVAKRLLAKNNGIENQLPIVLHLACYKGQIETAKLLLAHGVDVDAKDHIGFRTLKQELDKSGDAYPRAFLVPGYKAEPLFGLYGLYTVGIGRTIMRRSRASCHLGQDVHTKGATALHWASVGNQAKMTEFLLAKGADIHAADEERHTALHVASAVHSPDVAQVLLAHGADVNAKANDGITPLLLAKRSLSKMSKLHYNIRDYCDYSETDYPELVKLLRAYGATE